MSRSAGYFGTSLFLVPSRPHGPAAVYVALPVRPCSGSVSLVVDIESGVSMCSLNGVQCALNRGSNMSVH